jgi:16S rRNA (adenine1518-N6/adenine1519-N6)-dimethyltransferase
VHKKSFGQHFLHEKGVIHSIVRALGSIDDEMVVEIGPGGGALTYELIDIVPRGQLTLVEADQDLIPNLQEKYSATIVRADAAKVDFGAIVQERDWVLIGNLPYNAASAILMHALRADVPPLRSIIMVQKEQADRMLAKPGDMGLLSVAVQLYTQPKRLFNVKRGAFTPPPNVDSSVIELVTHTDVNTNINESILRLTRAGFASRRKQLAGNLDGARLAPKIEVQRILQKIGLTAQARAQELSVDHWRELHAVLTRKD